jgi:hypothetical protein
VQDFEYFLITWQSGIAEPIDGILGMSQKDQFIITDEKVDVGPLYIDFLAEQNLISTRQFSFYMNTPERGDSHVDLGPPLTSMMKGGTDAGMFELPINTDFFWS